MHINFNNDEHYEAGLGERGTYKDMLELRKKQLPKIQANIQKILEDYNGENITIIVQKEDENGMPERSKILMAGTARIECQIAMGKELSLASEKAIEVMMETAKKGGLDGLLALTEAVVKMAKAEVEVEHDSEVKVVTDATELPEDVRKAIIDKLTDMGKKKKGKK